jgi:hypothetical protein
MIISQVCSRWRHLALETPTLWRELALDGRTELWTQHLARARGCTLDVRLAHAPFVPRRRRHRVAPEWGHSTVQWALHPALPYLSHWRSLSLCFGKATPFLWNAALSPLCHPSALAPRLAAIELVYPANDDSKYFALFGGYAPRLRQATVSGVRLAWDHGVFGNLTSLDYAHPPFTVNAAAVMEVLDILRISSRLENLSISFLSRRRAVSPETPLDLSDEMMSHVQLRHLRVLQLSTHEYPLRPELMDAAARIIAPALRVLQLADTSRSLSAFEVDIAQLNCFSSVRYLTVEHGWASRQLVRDAVRVMPALSKITTAAGFPTRGVDLVVPLGQDRFSRRWLSKAGVMWVG